MKIRSFALAAVLLAIWPSALAEGPEIDAATIQRNFLHDYRAHLNAVRERIRHTDFSPSVLTSKRQLMQDYFSRLASATPKEQALLLEKINELRAGGYRFAKDVDPGLHVPFGVRWDSTRLGPYPATRLALGGYGASREQIETEVENAREALDHQTLREAMHGRMGMAYTDDADLLRSAIEFHVQEIKQDAQRLVKVARTLHV